MKSDSVGCRSELTGLILFGHGARDPRWREPFERLLALVQVRHSGPVSLAFLDHMAPDLVEASRALKSESAVRIVVVPVFFGTGGHIRRDLPELARSASLEVGIPVTVVGPAGEDERVLTAILEYAVSSIPLADSSSSQGN